MYKTDNGMTVAVNQHVKGGWRHAVNRSRLQLLLGDIDAKYARINAFDSQGVKRQGPAKNSVLQTRKDHKRRTLVERKGETRLTGFVRKPTGLAFLRMAV